jgi:hypothetical protein
MYTITELTFDAISLFITCAIEHIAMNKKKAEINIFFILTVLIIFLEQIKLFRKYQKLFCIKEVLSWE